MKGLTPFTPNSLNVQVEADIWWENDDVVMEFSLKDPDGAIVDSIKSGYWKSWPRAHDLWKSTCFEAFLSKKGETKYWELNLSPCWQKWNLYSFSDYRKPQPPQQSDDFQLMDVRMTDSTIQCRLKFKHPPETLEVSLTAVIKAKDGLHFYALKHASDKPDFHNRASFVHSIESID